MKLRMNADGQLDVVIEGGVVRETTIQTAILASLLCNRRADPQDQLPYGYQGKGGAITDDRQGWVGDVFDSKGRLLGSKLWLLDQELAIEDTKLRTKEYIRECLKWTIEDGYVSTIAFEDEWVRPNRLNLKVIITMINGEALTLRVDYETGAVYEL